MGGPVLPEADGIVRPNMQHGKVHQRSKADRAARIVGEDQVAGIVSAEARQHHAVHHRAHRVFADAVAQIVAAVVAEFAIGLKLARTRIVQNDLGAARDIRCAADNPRHFRGDGLEHLARGLARGDAGGVCAEARDIAVPAVREPAISDELEMLRVVWVRLGVVGE